MVTEADLLARIAAVKDPEIPTASIVDLGMVERVSLEGDRVEVDLLPTFAGCPALDVIRDDVTRAVAEAAPGLRAEVRFVLDPPWTTDRVTEDGRRALAAYGIAAAEHRVVIQIGRPRGTPCPYCGSPETEEQSAFGPSPCRTIRYCRACRNPFEGFKQKGPA